MTDAWCARDDGAQLSLAVSFDGDSAARAEPLSARAWRTLHSSRLGLSLLAGAVVFGAVRLAPEIHIGRVPLNDSVFHLAATERLIDSLRAGEPFLDPWVSEWGLGYPLWRSYQPLPHLLAAAVLTAVEPVADHAAAFAALQYVLLVLLPASVYRGARLLGLEPTAAGLASLLCLAPSGAGDLGRYGLGYGATTWRGSGLFTQLVALHLLPSSIGLAARALDTGRRRTLASLLLALTCLSHLVLGYVALLSAAFLVMVGPAGARARRLLRFATIALPAAFLSAWFVVPLRLAREEINHSRWEAAYKWDSFGAPHILRELASGQLLDAGRFPALSLLLLGGAVVAILRVADPLARRLLGLTGLWLILFFGRETWGHLLMLAAVPRDLHLHRLQVAFELQGVLLAAWGAHRAARAAATVGRPLAVGALVLMASLLVPILKERTAYLSENARWGEDNLAAFRAAHSHLEAVRAEVRAILAERPGRASAGLAGGWGGSFRVGAVPLYAMLSRWHVDEASFLFHSMSSTSDLMVLRHEEDPAHDLAFGVRAIVAPRDLPILYRRRRAEHGGIAVYEAAGEGYFGLVDLAGRYRGPPSTFYDVSSAWLESPLLGAGAVIGLGIPGQEARHGDPSIGRWQALPPVDPAFAAARGEVSWEAKNGETYRARLSLRRPCFALVRITWHPDLTASLDGQTVAIERVTPGFGAVAVPAGDHEIVVRYEPSFPKGAILVIGVLLFLTSGWALRQRAWAVQEEAWIRRIGFLGARFWTPRTATALGLLALSLLALRPLFRGRLIAGHDALEYPPRLVQMERALSDGHFPPVWAPDLGAGHGQPLFEFAPPLLYLSALPFRAAGAGLADALQFALAMLHLLGAVAFYRLARRASASRVTAAAGTSLWLFAPYTALDLYVRSAFAEASAVAVAPLALWGLWRAIDRPAVGRVAAGGVTVALVIFAHNAAALLLVPAFAVAVLARARGSRAAIAGGGVLLAALALSAFFWLPAMLEKSFVQTDLLREGFLHWSEHAIAPQQLLWSRWGYGLSTLGTGDGMSFALGLPHLVLGLAGLVAASRAGPRRLEALASAALALFGAWLATGWSAPVWSAADTLQYLAYPWRALMLPGLFLPWLAVPALQRLGRRGALAAAAVVILVNLGHTEPGGYHTFDDEYYAPSSIAEKGLNTTTREEYTPRWSKVRPAHSSTRLAARSGSLEILSERLSTSRQEFQVRASGDVRAEAATLYYPGWTVEVDGLPVRVTPEPVFGTMRFPVPGGDHRIVLTLHPTRVRRWSAAVSGLALAALALVLTNSAFR